MRFQSYPNQETRHVFLALQEHLGKGIAELFPGHILQQAGFSRNDLTEEVTIKLHLMPIGSTREIPGAKIEAQYKRIE